MAVKAFMMKALVVLALAVCTTSALRVKGGGSYSEEFRFLGKFCYMEYHQAKEDYGIGEAFVRIKASAVTGGTVFGLYYDEDASWQSAELNLPCVDRLRLARQQWYPRKPVEGSMRDTMEWTLRINDRPRFWYIAALNCDGSGIGELEYELHFENPGGWFTQEISYDKQSILEMDFFYIFFYAILLGVHGYSVVQLVRTKSFHPIVQLFTASLILTMTKIVCNWLFLVYQASTGYESTILEAAGIMSEFCAELFFCCLLILLCQGWTISHNHIKNKKIVLFAVVFLSVMFLVMYTWTEYFVSKADSTYIYETWPGTIICTVRFMLLLWCWNLLYTTYSEEVHPDKRKFYKRVALVFSPWFVALPVVVFFVHYIPPYMRQKVEEGITLTWTTILYCVLQWLLWPSKASDYFRLTPDEQNVLGTTPYDDL